MRTSKLLIAVVISIIAISVSTAAQTDPTLETGLKPYGSYHGGDLDSVNLSNGNLTLHIALPGYPQRGSLSYTPRLIYNSKGNWYVVPNCNSVTGICSPYWAWSYYQNPMGHGVVLDMTSEDAFGISWQPQFPGSIAYLISATTPDGSTHPFGGLQSGGMTTLDGTDLWYDGTTNSNFIVGTARDSRGNTMISNKQLKDPNGNFFSYPTGETFTDTLGRNFPWQYTSTTDTSGCTGPLAVGAGIYSLPGVNGGSTRQIKVCSAAVRVQSNFQASGYYNDSLTPIADRSYTVNMLQSVVLYNGTSWTGSPAWTFEYNDQFPGDPAGTNYGDLTKITLPTGGTISYTWSQVSACDPNNNITPISEGVTTRTINANDGTGPQIWKYGQGGALAFTDPAGNDTMHVLTALNNSCSLYETETKYYQGSYTTGTLLKDVVTDYRWITNPFDKVNPANTTLTVTNVFPIHITTTLSNGLVSRIEKDYDNNLIYTWPGGGGTASYGNVIEVREYDYGNGVHGPLLRRTDYTYKAFDGSPSAAAYLAANLVHLVSSVTVYDGNNNQAAKTTYGYDESALQPSAGSSSITTQHDTSLSNPGTRGNLTSVSRWLNTTGGTITTKTAYYDTGTIYQVTDPNLNTTTNFYGTGFQSGSSFVGAYVTQVQNALQQSTYFDYDFNTGLRTALKDPNGQISSWDYDFLNRTLHSNAPDNGKITWTYSDTQPPSFTVSSTISSSLNHVVEADLDGLGRLAHSKLTSDPEGIDTVDTTYDPLGRVSTVSNPHRSTASSTDGTTTTYYDALGRVVQVAGPDGTLLPSGTAVTLCQANNTCTGYSNFPTVTVTDQAGNQRRSRTDALGRLVEVDEPAAIGGPTAATGTISISSVTGGDQNVQVQTHAATQATAWVEINGFEEKMLPSDCPEGQSCGYEYDNGECSIFAQSGATPAGSVQYGASDNSGSIAANLASQINAGNLLTAWVSGSTVYLTTRQAGTSENFNLWASCSSYNPDFANSGFYTTQSGAYFTGGTDAVYTTVYDSGTVSLTIPGCSSNPSASYSQSVNNTASLVASALAGSVNSITSCPVIASASGATITFTATQPGSGVNVSVTGSSSTSQGAYFSQTSFSASSGTVSGGLDHTGGFLTPAVTLYTYDTLGNLTQVDQQGFSSTCDTNCRVRSFQYNSLSQLLTATNPESGTISYSYDADGNVLQKTAPAPNQTGSATQTISYCYDALNRITGKAYSAQTCQNGQLPAGTAAASYFYDQAAYQGLTIANGIGRLTGIADQAGNGAYSFDPMGRIATEQRSIAGVTKSMSYTYNLDGSVNTLTYPGGATVTYTLESSGTNTSGRMLLAADTGNNINYVTQASYGPDGGLTGFTSGGTITNSFSYNNRLQPVNMSATASSGTVFSINYDFHAGAGDNGNVFAITNNKDANRNQTFTYDQLNRLASAQNAGTDCSQSTVNGKSTYWGNGYTYDAWGNLLNKGNLPGATGPKCNSESLDVTADTQNRLHVKAGADYQFDAAGNMTYNAKDALYYTYDQENRITGAGGYTYTYDDDGNRVEKSNGSTGTLYWYMSPGIVAESDLLGNLQSEYVFFDGERVARKDFPGGAVSYYFSDHLKTTDIVTDAQGNIKNESDFYPWGGELQFLANDSNHYKFTGKERDSETGLDYFGARYYSNGLGRFVTPDWAAIPEPVPYADLGDPQSLNQYSYVRNIPTVKVDADGHDGCCDTDIEVDMEMVKQTLQQLGPAAGPALVAGGTVVFAVADVVGIAWIGHELVKPSHTAGQSNDDEQAAIQQASQERAAQNGGVDPQQTPEPAPAAAAGGRGKKGGPLGPVKAEDAPGVTAGGQATNKHGQKLGASGKPVVHNVNKNTREAARNAANKGSGTIHDRKTKRGRPHFHTKRGTGAKKRDGVHYNYPK